MSRSYPRPSEAQINADALARRGSPYGVASASSVRRAWDANKREPRDLREAVHFVRCAYADEIPDKLHDGPDAIGPDGTPRMAARAEGYIFGSPDADDAATWTEDDGTRRRDLVGYYFTPFRALLDRWQRGDEAARKRAAIVSHVTIGQQDAVPAAIAEGVPRWCAYIVAEHALRWFARELTDLRVHSPARENQTEAVTAA